MKKLFQHAFIVFVFIILQACNTAAELKSHDTVGKQPQKGYYIVGHEVNSFQPCGQEKVFWVIGAEETLQAMAQQYNRYTHQAYKKVFVKLNGYFMPKALDGFAKDYDGQLFIVKLLSMSTPSKNDCL